jgi:hypothetical protein
MSKLDVNRRKFLKITGLQLALHWPCQLPDRATSCQMVGIQVGAVSFVDEGTEKVVDVLQERAGCKWLAAYSPSGTALDAISLGIIAVHVSAFGNTTWAV